MGNEDTEGEEVSLEERVEDSLEKIEIRLNRKLTAYDITNIHKWIEEYHFGMDIIDQAFMQSWGYGRVYIDTMDDFLQLWHDNKLVSVVQIRTYEKEQGRKVF